MPYLRGRKAAQPSGFPEPDGDGWCKACEASRNFGLPHASCRPTATLVRSARRTPRSADDRKHTGLLRWSTGVEQEVLGHEFEFVAALHDDVEV